MATIPARDVVAGTSLRRADGVVGVVVDVLHPDWDRAHVGIRIVTADGVSNGVFPIDAPVTIA